jgi:hypothetical protein
MKKLILVAAGIALASTLAACTTPEERVGGAGVGAVAGAAVAGPVGAVVGGVGGAVYGPTAARATGIHHRSHRKYRKHRRYHHS